MKIGDRIYVRGYVDEIRKDTVIVRNNGGYFGTIPSEVITGESIHAHWIPCENETGEGSNIYKCSACGEIQMLIDGTPKENGWAYCPHCGAKMDEKNEVTK